MILIGNEDAVGMKDGQLEDEGRCAVRLVVVSNISFSFTTFHIY